MGTGRGESQLQSAIGAQAVSALVKVFPGQRIYVPWQSAEALMRFAENFAPLIGVERVAVLVDQFGGLRMQIPSRMPKQRAKGFLPIDVDRVAELTDAGLNATQIAKILKCDPRTVHAARTKARGLGILKARKRRPAA